MDVINKTEIVCAALIVENDSFIIIQEAKKGIREKWNIPGGHIEPGEDIFSATIREVKEETNLDIKLDGIIGIYQEKIESNIDIIKIIFSCSNISENQFIFSKDEILDVKWISFNNFFEMKVNSLRTENLRDIVKDFLEKGSYSLNIIKN